MNIRFSVFPVVSLWILLGLTLGLSTVSYAEITAEADRTEISENESVQLVVSTNLKLSSTMDLFNLNTLSIPQPDISALEKDFEILDRQQSYQVKIENNQNNSVITWTYTLMPKISGDIIIPAITYEGESSEPIPLRVRKASDTHSTQKKLVYLESETDLNEAYVQQQIIYKVRLYYALDLISGEMEHPDHQDAFFKQIGKQKEFSRFVGSQRFSVIERTYAVFPKVAGTLTIPEVKFSGAFIKRRYGKRVYYKESTDSIDIKVNPPPAEFTGDIWLPAQSLSIRDVWSNPAREINVGDSLTRTIQTIALGLEAVQLPPLPSVNIGGLKVYPEPGKLDIEEHAAGFTGKREDTQALIATTPGTYTLPEIRIPWWDVNNNEERVAILPGRVITVVGAAAVNDNLPDSTTSAVPQQSVTDSLNQSDDYNNRGYNLLWQLAACLFFVLWIITTFLWWRKPGVVRPPVQAPAPVSKPLSLEHLQKLAEQGSSSFVTEFNRWLSEARTSRNLTHELADSISEQVRPTLIELQRKTYGPEGQGKVDQHAALAVVKQIRELIEQNRKAQKDGLAELYPVQS